MTTEVSSLTNKRVSIALEVLDHLEAQSLGAVEWTRINRSAKDLHAVLGKSNEIISAIQLLREFALFVYGTD